LKSSDSSILSGSNASLEAGSDNSPQSPQLQHLGRVCNSCGLFKPWIEFDKKPRGINGHDSRCKSCIAKQKLLLRERKKIEHKNALKRLRKTTTVLSISDFSIERIYCPINEDGLSGIMKDFIETLILTEQQR
jgi:hypothetical protein